MKNNHYHYYAILLAILISSCVPHKKLLYFTDSNKLTTIDNKKEQKRIQPFDFLYIRVLSTDEKTAQIFNFTDAIRSYDTKTFNYTVDENGNISFPFVGLVNMKGLTLNEAEIKIQKILSEYVTSTAQTSIVIRFADNRISVMGEVNRQGEYQFIPDKINIYEALALAGGITRFGNRKNIILIRRNSNQVNYYKLDLSNSNIAKSEFFDIKHGDIVVVEPLKSISWSYQSGTYSSILSTIGTLIAIISITLR